MKEIVNVANHTMQFAAGLEEARAARTEYFKRLRRAEREWQDSGGASFNEWLEQEYGIRVIEDSSGYITSSYTVVNEKKYMLWCLKFCNC